MKNFKRTFLSCFLSVLMCSNLFADTIYNDAVYTLTTGTNTDTILGIGSVDIFGTVINAEGTLISQNSIIIDAFNSGNSFTANPDDLVLTGGISNDKNLTFTGTSPSTNNSTISGSGGLFIASYVTNANGKSITQAMLEVLAGGEFYTNAGDITANMTNNGKLIFTGGINENPIIGSGALEIENTVSNMNGIAQDSLKINSSADFTSLIDDLIITSDIINDGIFRITGGDNTHTIIGDGATIITGTVNNTGSITQENLTVNNGGDFTTTISGISIANTITNDGDFRLNGSGNLTNSIIQTDSGLGDLYLSGAMTNTDDKTITQNNLAISAGGSLTTDAGLLSIGNTISNSGDIIFTGGTNVSEISGTGDLTITGAVINTVWKTINQANVEITSAGALNINADYIITANAIGNDGTLTFTGGTNANTITGAGKTVITGTVSNTEHITQDDLTVNSGGDFTTTISGITIANAITNDGDLRLDGSGNLTNSITRTGSGLGDLYLSGAMTNTDDKTITQNNLNISGGGSLVTNAGFLSIENAIVNSGILTLNGGINSNTVTGEGDLNITGTVTNTGVITQYNLNITSTGDFITELSGMIILDDILNDGNLRLNGSGNLGSNIIQTSVAEGSLFINGVITNTAGKSIAQNTLNIGSGGDFTTEAGLLTINGGSVTNDGILRLSGSGALAYGISNNTSDNGNLYLAGSLANSSSKTISQNTLTITSGSDFTTNAGLLTLTSGITNAGTLTYTGGTNNSSINGAGNLQITGSVTNTSGKSINQNSVLISGSGSFTAGAADITTVNGITNNALLTFNGNGNNNNDISGSGSLTVSGTVRNAASKTISQGGIHITESGTLVSDASYLVSSSTPMINDGILTFTGGTNANAMTGAGVVIIDGTVINQAVITQDDLEINTESDFTTAVSDIVIGNPITNYGNLRLNGNGDLSNNIVNNGLTALGNLFLSGTMTNTANREIHQNSLEISSSGSLTTAANLLNVSNAISNAGTLIYTGGTNNSAISGTGNLQITGEVTNSTGKDISQNTITIEGIGSGLSANASELTAVNGVLNNAALNLTGGTNVNNINGTGFLTVAGSVLNTTGKKIEQDGGLSILAAGSLTANAGDILSTDISNGGILTFNGGTNSNTITGTGSTVITGTVVNEELITQAHLTINNGAGLTTAISDIVIGSAITNNGDLRLNGSGSLSNIVTNSVTGQGNLYLSGNMNNSGNMAITQDRLEILYGGQLTTAANLLNIENTIANAGTLIYTGGINSSAMSGAGDLSVTGAVVNTDGKTITQGGLSVSGSFTANASDLVISGGITNSNALMLTGGTNNNLINNTGTLKFNGGSNNNTVSGTGAFEVGGTVSNTAGKAITQNSLKVEAAGTLTANAKDLHITSAIVNEGVLRFNDGEGVNNNAVSGNGILEVTGKVTNTAGKSIAQNEIKVTGTLAANASDITASLFENSGTLTFTGGTNSNTITGTGSAVISGAVINSGGIAQNNLKINNAASLSSAISDLNITAANDIVNDGSLTLTGSGNFNNNIVNTDVSYGKLIVGGTIANSALKTVTQNDLEIEAGGSLSTGAALLSIRNAIANSGSLLFTGGANNNIISGGGHTVIGGNVTNNSGKTITQETITIDAGAELRSNASDLHAVTGIENAGSLVFTDTSGTSGNIITGNGALTVHGTVVNITGKTISQGSITVEGSFTANAGDILSAPITNTGSLTFNGGVSANSISGTGNTFITGNVTNTASLSQRNVNVSAAGNFTTNAALLAASEEIKNDGILSFTGGSNANIITGAGELQITGNVMNTASVSQNKLGITTSGNFTSSIDNIHVSNGIINDGMFTLNGNGTLSSSIKNSLSGQGALNIGGSLENAAGNIISQNALNISATGSFTVNGNDLRIEGAINNTGVLTIMENNFKAGSLSLSSNGSVFNMQNFKDVTAEFDSMDSASGSLIKMEVYADGRNDYIKVNNTADLDGSLTVRPGVGKFSNVTFDLIEAGTLTGYMPDNIEDEAVVETLNRLSKDSAFTYNFFVENNTIKLNIDGTGGSDFSSLKGLSYNQKSVAAMLDKASKTSTGDFQNVINNMVDATEPAQKEALSEIAPYFIANIVRAPVNNKERNGLYKRIDNYFDTESNLGIWAEGNGGAMSLGSDDNSINDYSNTNMTFKIGADRYFEKADIIIGAYGIYRYENIEQGKSSSDGSVFGAGGYAGTFRGNFDIKGLLSFGYGTYDNTRSIRQRGSLIDRKAKSDLDALTVSVDLEGAYELYASKTVALRPFAGVEAALLSYDDFSESGADSLNLKVKGDSNISSALRAGFGADGQQYGINWAASIEYNFIMSGNENEIESKTEGGDWFKTRGSEIGNHVFGVNLGADYFVSQDLNVYISGGANFAGEYNNYTGTFGVRYFFKGM